MLFIPQSDSSFDGTIDYKTTNYCKQKIQQLNEKLEKMNSWVHLYYCLKFRNQFRAWLWEKVREPRIRKHFHYTHLVEILEGADEYTADERVKKWINNYEGVSEDDI
jgi:hypothetical protein